MKNFVKVVGGRVVAVVRTDMDELVGMQELSDDESAVVTTGTLQDEGTGLFEGVGG